MNLVFYSGYRLPRRYIQRVVWMYLRFTLSFRDVEELLAERGITVREPDSWLVWYPLRA